MKVTLVAATPNALDILIDTKSSRMRGKPVSEMTAAEKEEHWAYMLDTIRSPFEFVDYIFKIEGVSRNFCLQLVRTRTGAYQQETNRALNMADVSVVRPAAFDENEDLAAIFGAAEVSARDFYQELVDYGADLQDARAVLPGNISAVIEAKFDLRTLSDMAKNRLCVRTQGEYQTVFREMRRLVLELHPWAEPLLQPHCIAVGTCAFPRYGQTSCPFYDPRMDLTQLKRDVNAKFWAADITTANPVAINGKSM